MIIPLRSARPFRDFRAWHILRCSAQRFVSRKLSISDSPLNSLRDRQLPIVTETLSADQHLLLRDAIRDFLPPISTNLSPSETLHLPAGHHLVYFRPSPPTPSLLEDGTDDLHAPDRSWKYRVWAGGCLTFPSPSPILLDSSRASLVETIDKVRPVGEQGDPSKVFVQIKRDVFRVRSIAESEAIQRYAHSRPQLDPPQTPLLTEIRTLCFLRQIPMSLTTPTTQKSVPPPSILPSTRVYEVTLTPTPALLFRFSALTFNAHAIHIDPLYTRDVYGLPGLLVHGPLTLLLMLEVLGRAVSEQSTTTKGIALREFNYKNLGPVFVNEEITICCSRHPTKQKGGGPQTAGSKDEAWNGEAQEWQVWIQKNIGDDVTVAVRGTGFYHVVDD